MKKSERCISSWHANESMEAVNKTTAKNATSNQVRLDKNQAEPHKGT
jgi:hypothetical protein